MNWKGIAVAAAIASSIVGVYAQQTQPPAQGMGPGMVMDRTAPGYGMRGHGGGDGMGPGMMGPGMMGQGMMGPGMMGGMGMMGDFGLHAIARLDLDDSQRKQVLRVEDEVRKKNWELMGRMHDEMAKMRDAMWVGEKRDRAAILAASKRMAELRQQMLENSLDATEKAEAILTPQQREQLKRFGR